jgi:large subunit ribosomal protein L9
VEVILLQHVENLGRRGETVKVRPGFARNYLLPRGMVALATAGAKRRVEQESRKFVEHDDRARADATAIAERMTGLELSMPVKADEEGKLYGSVSAQDLHTVLVAQGFELERKQIVLEHTIKALGEHTVHVKLHPDVRGTVKVTVVRNSMHVIMAGGVGTFWPRSRRPAKQLRRSPALRHDPHHRGSAAAAHRRRARLGRDRRRTNDGVRRETSRAAPDHILVEPARNTAPCIGVAARALAAQGAGDEAMVVLASDHVIQAEERFRRLASPRCISRDRLLTLGIRPTRPETGFGYIPAAASAFSSGQDFVPVRRFVESRICRPPSVVASGDLCGTAACSCGAQPHPRRIAAPRQARPRARRLGRAWGTGAWEAS